MLVARLIDLLRILIILVLSFLFSFLLPPIALAKSTGSVVEILVLFAFLLGFFVNRALERKQMISRATSLELLHLRRIYHLCESISDRKWAQHVFLSLAEYHSAVSKFFLSHTATLKYFRSISHLIYSFQPKKKKDEMLFSELLHTTRDLAFERQQIEQALANRLSGYSWMVMLISAGFGIVLLLINRYESQYTPLGCAFLVSTILLSLDLLLRTDHFSKSEINAFQNAYQSNTPHQRTEKKG